MRKAINEDEVLKLYKQLDSLHIEISVLVKKSPNDAINTFKIAIINRVLEQSNSVLGTRYKALDSFDKFDVDELPTTSDVSMILGIYRAAFQRLCTDNDIELY